MAASLKMENLRNMKRDNSIGITFIPNFIRAVIQLKLLGTDRRALRHLCTVSFLFIYGDKIFSLCNMKCHVRWFPCHHGMARPQVADGGTFSGYGG